MSSSNSFKPAWWLPGPHLQTLWPVLFRRRIKNIPLEYERFELPDGDFLDLVWIGKHNSGPLTVMLHGLEGSMHSPYVQGMLHTLHQQNWRGVLMHFRGCSGVPNRLPRSYHSGETEDLNDLVRALRKREPDTHLSAIGFSLGGNVLLKWLGETGANNPLSAAVAVSVPFELQKAAHRIQQGFSKVYQRHFLKCLSERLEIKFKAQAAPIKFPPFSELKTMREFDDKVTAPLHGFSSVSEYYSIASSRQYLRSIRVPTLLLQSEDDPFMMPEGIPTEGELSEFTRLEVTKTGGHVGFVTGTPWRPEYWLEQRIPLFLREYVPDLTNT